MNNPSLIDYFSLGILILLAVVVFLVRILMPDIDKSPLVDTLFSFFEITFALFIGFIIQRIDSTNKFQENLRKYGLSAHRRISDISKSLARAKTEISLKRKSSTENNAHIFDALSAIIEGIDETVKSSITDWIDIIGEDLKTQEKIQELEANLAIQKRAHAESEDEKNKIQDLQNEIMVLKSKLPYSLLVDQQMVLQEDVDMHLSKMVSATSSFILQVGFINTNNVDNFMSTVKERKPYTFSIQRENMETPINEINVYDNQHVFIGQVINTISKPDDWYFYQKIGNILERTANIIRMRRANQS
jgi:hypothetical protein